MVTRMTDFQIQKESQLQLGWVEAMSPSPITEGSRETLNERDSRQNASPVMQHSQKWQ